MSCLCLDIARSDASHTPFDGSIYTIRNELLAYATLSTDFIENVTPHAKSEVAATRLAGPLELPNTECSSQNTT